VKYCFHNETKKRKQMSESQTASTEVTIEGLSDLFDKQKAYFATARAPLARPIRAFFYTGCPNGYIEYPEFSRS
jgi:hypothetical protein